MKIGVIGASGYSGWMLLKLLSRHPGVEVACVASRSHAGKRVQDVLPSLARTPVGEISFVASDPAELASGEGVDLFFLALPHGVAAEFALPLVESGKRVIDLSADFRLFDPEVYKSYYGHPHPAPEWLVRAPYVIPELAEEGWENAPLIACPGCYPTSIQLPLVPLLRAGLIEADGICIAAMSGVSGAGRKASELYSYCERNEAVMPYGAPRHRHLSEVEEQLSRAAGAPVVVDFVPHLAPMNQGISTTVFAQASASQTEIKEALSAQYAGSPFVNVLEGDAFPSTLNVVNTNRADLAFRMSERTGRVLFFSAIDNLVKGASGQAVQIMNRIAGFDETAGLL